MFLHMCVHSLGHWKCNEEQKQTTLEPMVPFGSHAISLFSFTAQLWDRGLSLAPLCNLLFILLLTLFSSHHFPETSLISGSSATSMLSNPVDPNCPQFTQLLGGIYHRVISCFLEHSFLGSSDLTLRPLLFSLLDQLAFSSVVRSYSN